MKIAGILNITSDSFSDANLYLTPEASSAQAEKLIREGADIIDLGAQSSNPNAQIVHDELEWERINSVIQYFKNRKVVLSVDTYKPFVIKKSIENGIDYINNIMSFIDTESKKVLSDYVPEIPDLILMFSHKSTPKAVLNSNLSVETILDTISFFFEDRIRELNTIGVPRSKIYFDPGMGFFLGEDPNLSFKVLGGIQILKKRFDKIFISVSRKSFLGNVLGKIPPLERREATLSAELYLAESGVDIIRTHEPLPLKRALIIKEEIMKFKEF